MDERVERIMLLKLVSPEQRADVARLSHSALSSLPGLSELSVGLPSDAASEKSWDVSLVMRFATQAELETALASSVFHDYVSRDLADKCAVTKAWSFARITP
jgi:hypothetical protein